MKSLAGVVSVLLESVVPVSNFVKVLSDVVVEALAVGIAVEVVLADVNVNISAVVMMTALEFPMSMS